jgi:hypothetical protein
LSHTDVPFGKDLIEKFTTSFNLALSNTSLLSLLSWLKTY